MPSSRDVEAVSPLVDEYSRLLSFAAHELRTPASVIGGYLRMLQSDTSQSLSDRHRTLVDHAAKSCVRLIELIAELSEVGKLDNGTAPVHIETFDLFSDLDDVAAAVVEGRDRDVTFAVTGASSGAVLTGDRQRLTTAFSAIFRALLREQGLPIAVCAERRIMQHPSGRTAVVAVAPVNALAGVLERPAVPFEVRRGGMGLSLPIARRVIEHTGGRVWTPLIDGDGNQPLKSAAIISIPLAS